MCYFVIGVYINKYARGEKQKNYIYIALSFVIFHLLNTHTRYMQLLNKGKYSKSSRLFPINKTFSLLYNFFSNYSKEYSNINLMCQVNNHLNSSSHFLSWHTYRNICRKSLSIIIWQKMKKSNLIETFVRIPVLYMRKTITEIFQNKKSYTWCIQISRM